MHCKYERVLSVIHFPIMGTDEKSKLLIEFMHQNNTLKEVVELLKSEHSSSLDYKTKFEEEHRQLDVAHEQNMLLQKRLDALLSTIESLREQLSLMNQHQYGSKSQKRKPVKPVLPSEDHSRDKDDFDGTAGSLGSSVSSASGTGPSDEFRVDMGDAVREKELRLYRQGLSYRTMSADSQVFHKSDACRLPYGAVLIKRLVRYSYEQVSRIVEHDYEVLRYKTSDGLLHEGYFPAVGSPEIVDVVPGTHASGSLLAYLAFNKYVLDTPLYCEMYRLCGERMSLSRMTLTNWLEKGSLHFQELVRELKERCLEKALRYMDTFWTQLFAYRHDGSYSIDNSIAERFIRPLAGERKNSLFFGSNKMVRVSAVYHTIISTCRMQGVPVLEYFKRFFGEIVKGRRDYGNLLPLTIGISNNKY